MAFTTMHTRGKRTYYNIIPQSLYYIKIIVGDHSLNIKFIISKNLTQYNTLTIYIVVLIVNSIVISNKIYY